MSFCYDFSVRQERSKMICFLGDRRLVRSTNSTTHWSHSTIGVDVWRMTWKMNAVRMMNYVVHVHASSLSIEWQHVTNYNITHNSLNNKTCLGNVSAAVEYYYILRDHSSRILVTLWTFNSFSLFQFLRQWYFFNINFLWGIRLNWSFNPIFLA